MYKTKSKQFWADSNSKLKTKAKILTLKDDQCNLAKTDQEKAAMLNIFFRSVFTIEDLNSLPLLDIKLYGRPLCNITFLVGTVRTKLRIPDKAPCPDGTHPYLLCKLANFLCHPLSILFTKSLEEMNAHYTWKEGHFTPRHKKGSKGSPETTDQSA